jgi:hypothetical protein
LGKICLKRLAVYRKSFHVHNLNEKRLWGGICSGRRTKAHFRRATLEPATLWRGLPSFRAERLSFIEPVFPVIPSCGMTCVFFADRKSPKTPVVVFFVAFCYERIMYGSL